MSAIKIRIARALKAFGLHPRSELEELREQSRRDLAWLKKRNDQLQRRNDQLLAARKRLEKRVAQLQRGDAQPGRTRGEDGGETSAD
ncbi:hypothetical protein GBA63_17290 [Rubrobacter tropicus]|uniref:Uncharacterized protein n=1 Tax=Rubrobacter tropicus TaxID=2653851 RepID=A0A6G8QCI6_9ACTN|nr:hypothetical protein [Rubrobacter tropicus]QIN84210.1 hypothetical protein GBA63_17290 [Rubrobacter tropicus]